jgi:hypothetical protein
VEGGPGGAAADAGEAQDVSEAGRPGSAVRAARLGRARAARRHSLKQSVVVPKSFVSPALTWTPGTIPVSEMFGTSRVTS